MSNPPPPAPLPPPVPPASQSQSRQQTWIVVAVIVAIVCVIFGVAFYLLFIRSDNEPTSTDAPTSSESSVELSTSPEVSETPSFTPTEPEPSSSPETLEEPDDIFVQLSRAPDSLDGFALPAGMYTFSDYGFKTPSGNIFCYFNNGKLVPEDAGKLSCEMQEYVVVRPEEAPDPGPADLTFHGGTTDVGTDEVVYGAFRGGANGLEICAFTPELELCDSYLHVSTLDYGQAIRHGDIACLSEESGLTCVSLSLGKGVWVNRSDYGYIFR